MPQIWERGGTIFGITSQSQKLADKAQKKWKLNFDVISDTQNTLAKAHNIHISPNPVLDYPNGMVQPGLLIVTSKKELMYHWAVSPKVMNLEGAIDRPDPKDIVKVIINKLDGRNDRVKVHTSTSRWMIAGMKAAVTNEKKVCG